jgi:hypothetical protein
LGAGVRLREKNDNDNLDGTIFKDELLLLLLLLFVSSTFVIDDDDDEVMDVIVVDEEVDARNTVVVDR